MNKENIREGLIVWFAGYDSLAEKHELPMIADTLNSLLLLLKANGVVIKVDRELPSGGEARITAKHIPYWRGYDQSQIDIREAGYVAVEELI